MAENKSFTRKMRPYPGGDAGVLQGKFKPWEGEWVERSAADRRKAEADFPPAPKVHPLLNRRRKERRAICGDRSFRTEGGWTGPCDKMKGHEPPHHYTGT